MQMGDIKFRFKERLRGQDASRCILHDLLVQVQPRGHVSPSSQSLLACTSLGSPLRFSLELFSRLLSFLVLVFFLQFRLLPIPFFSPFAGFGFLALLLWNTVNES